MRIEAHVTPAAQGRDAELPDRLAHLLLAILEPRGNLCHSQALRKHFNHCRPRWQWSFLAAITRRAVPIERCNRLLQPRPKFADDVVAPSVEKVKLGGRRACSEAGRQRLAAAR